MLADNCVHDNVVNVLIHRAGAAFSYVWGGGGELWY